MAYFQTESLWVNRLADGVADLVLDVPGGKVNTLDRSVLTDLDKALDEVAQDATFRVLVVRTAKPASFCAGLALSVLAQMTPVDFSEISALGQQLCDKLASLPLPTVALIAGGCLGGGLELALSCDYRVAVNKPTTILGFPEAELGLIPMWGGCQRLPKLVGLDRGLQMLLGGRRLLSRDAKAWGLVDEVTEDGDSAPPAFLQNPHKRAPAFLPLRTWRQKFVESTRLGRSLIFRRAKRLLRNRLPDAMPAPWQALDAVRTGLRLGMEAGLARERAAVLELAQTEACRNLIRLHLERDQLRRSAAQGQENPRAIGVIGEGSRAAALMHMAITKGYPVVMRAASDTALGYALFRLLNLFKEEVARGTMPQADLMKNLANIRGTTAWKGFENVDLVLEAIEEERGDKSALFKELEKRTDAKAILVTTGSSMTVGQLQAGMTRPERVAGLHFLAPLSRSLLVEVVASERTQPDVSRRLMGFVAALGRAPRPVKDEPGLLIERLLIPYGNEAILLVKEGLDPARVDEAMVRFGMIHGPLEYLDLMGLDVAAPLVQALTPLLEPRLALDETFAFMAGKKWLGQKAEIGFYRYRGKKQIVNRHLVAHLQADSGQRKMEALSRADQLARARQRLVLLTINEAAWCLEEGRVEGPEALDLALMLAGWAPHRGGPLHYARHLGIVTVIKDLQDLAVQYGQRYEPCPALRRQDFIS